MVEKELSLLQSMPIFGGINEDSLRYLLSLASLVKAERDSYFFCEGDPGDSMFVLNSGAVSLTKSSDDQTYLLRKLAVGDCFGILTLLDLGPRSGSALARADSTAIEISSTHLYEIYNQDPEQYMLLQMNLAREVSRRLREADRQYFKTILGEDTESRILFDAV